MLMSFCASAAWHAPYSGSRIFWLPETRKTVFESGGYARLIQLQDGRLMAVCESNGINAAFSTDNGNTWSSPVKIAANPNNNVPNCVPDLIQLVDGTIIVGYNPRPREPYTEDRHFGIRCRRSTDNGNTWSDEINVYDASFQGSDGCWEPTFLQLPSGEVQLYFADESPFTNSNDQQISMCRSYDKGLTWTSPQRVAYRSKYRDGMPSAVLLNDGATIALAFEDNGWSGFGDFIPSIATCPLTTDWNNYWVSGNSQNRWQAVNYDYSPRYVGGAPYLRKLPDGETILSYQGRTGGEDLHMLVYVGNENAKDFKAASEPFGQTPSLWNSLATIDTGTVVAVGAPRDSHIEMIKGRRANRQEAPYAHPVIDGRQSANDGYLTANATQLLLGHSNAKTRFTADFAYDDDSLYFTSRVSDVTPYALHSSYSDGITFFIDTRNASDEYPVEDVYRFFFRLDSTYVAYEGGANHRWNRLDVKGINYTVRGLRRYYVIEAAIPWKALGFNAPPTESIMRANVMLQDNSTGGNTVTYDMMPDALRDASWTWMEFRLKEHQPTGIDQMKIAHGQSFSKNDGTLPANDDIRKVELFNTAGVKIVESADKDALPLSKGVNILRISTKNNNTVTRNFFVK